LCDFGSARCLDMRQKQTSLPVTVFYTCPGSIERGRRVGEIGRLFLRIDRFRIGDRETGVRSRDSDCEPRGPDPVRRASRAAERDAPDVEVDSGPGWKADPARRATMAEVCRELSEVDWLAFPGADAGRVKREAAGLPLFAERREGCVGR
jgi:hypothetical protein